MSILDARVTGAVEPFVEDLGRCRSFQSDLFELARGRNQRHRRYRAGVRIVG